VPFTILHAREATCLLGPCPAPAGAKVCKDATLSSHNPLVLRDEIHILIDDSSYKEIPLERHMKI
jgi:hypothetical protein